METLSGRGGVTKGVGVFEAREAKRAEFEHAPWWFSCSLGAVLAALAAVLTLGTT